MMQGVRLLNKAQMTTTHEVLLPLFSSMAQTTKRYRTIVADPPWPPLHQAARRYDGQINEHNAYPTMSTQEIANTPVGLWAEESAHLYLWALNSNLEEAHRIVRQWGFEPKTIVTWVKGRIENGRVVSHIGLGYYWRNATDHIIFATRNNLKTKREDVANFFIAPRTVHSEKPAIFYDLVEQMSPGPYLDVFARVQRMRWDTFGDESFDFRTNAHWHKPIADQ